MRMALRAGGRASVFVGCLWDGVCEAGPGESEPLLLAGDVRGRLLVLEFSFPTSHLLLLPTLYVMLHDMRHNIIL